MQKYNPLRKGFAVVIFVLFIEVCLFPYTGGVENFLIPTFDDPTIVRMAPLNKTAYIGEPFSVSIYVEPGEPIIAIVVDYLYFDPNFLQVTDTQWDLFFSGAPSPGRFHL